MKRSPRVIVLGFIVCLFIALLAGAQAPSQPGTQKEATAQKKAPRWETLTRYGKKPIRVLRGFEKTKCPDNQRDKKREVAIVELDENRHQEFQQDPKEFVNDYGIFSCAVRDMKQLRPREEIKNTSLGVDTMMQKRVSLGVDTIMMNHEPNCVAYFYD